MRLALLLLTSCTIAGSSRMREVTPRNPLATVPSEALDHQDPGADTSNNKELSRDVAESPDGPPHMTWRGGAYDALAAVGYALALSAAR